MILNLASVEDSTAAGSSLLGPNALGGAINLVSKIPEPGFSGEFVTRIFMDSDFESNGIEAGIKAGSREDDWFWQLALFGMDRKGFPLSSDFQTTTRMNAGRPLEDGGLRNNSEWENRQINLKLGKIYARGERTLIYSRLDGKKQNPAYAGNVATVQARFWRWPMYDKKSISFQARHSFEHGQKIELQKMWFELEGLAPSFHFLSGRILKPSTHIFFTELERSLKWGSANLRIESVSERTAFLTGANTYIPTGDHTLAHLNFSIPAGSDKTFEFGVQNLTDKNIELTPGFPSSGRQFHAGLRV